MEVPKDISFGSNYTVIGALGEGAFSQVFKLQDKRTNEFFAVKRLNKTFKSLDEASRNIEVEVLRALQGHPNIVKLENVFYDAEHGSLALVFECLDVNLYELISGSPEPFDDKVSLVLVYQMLKALSFIHSLNMFHRDIKPENCMVNRKTFELKLVDFGSTRQTSARGPFTEYVSTRWYRAPECILTSGSYGPPVDMWAVGCVLYELITGEPLFPGNHELDQICRIHNLLGTPSRELLAKFGQNPNTEIEFTFPPRRSQNLKLLLPDWDPDIVDLMSKMLKYNPIDRITADEALKHPAFAEIRRDEKKWKEEKMTVPLSSYLLRDHVAMPMVAVERPVKVPGKSIYMWQKEFVDPAEVKQKEAIELQQRQQAQQTPPKKQTDLTDARRAAAERVREYNKKHTFVKKQQPKVVHSLVMAPRPMQKPMNLPRLVVGSLLMKKSILPPIR